MTKRVELVFYQIHSTRNNKSQSSSILRSIILWVYDEHIHSIHQTQMERQWHLLYHTQTIFCIRWHAFHHAPLKTVHQYTLVNLHMVQMSDSGMYAARLNADPLHLNSTAGRSDIVSQVGGNGHPVTGRSAKMTSDTHDKGLNVPIYQTVLSARRTAFNLPQLSLSSWFSSRRKLFGCSNAFSICFVLLIKQLLRAFSGKSSTVSWK